MRPVFVFTALLGVTACGHVRIDEVSLVEPATSLGDASTSLIQTPGTAAPDVLTERVLDIEEALIELAKAHDDWSAANGAGRTPDTLALPVDAGPLRWDGTTLSGTLTTETSLVESTLRFQDRRTEFAASGGDAVCVAYEASGTAMHVECHPFLDRSLLVSHTEPDGSRIDIDATYGLVLDGDRCAAGGQIDLGYRITPPDDATREGVVSATFHGCGRIQVFSRD